MIRPDEPLGWVINEMPGGSSFVSLVVKDLHPEELLGPDRFSNG
jgi:hypothetical protein